MYCRSLAAPVALPLSPSQFPPLPQPAAAPAVAAFVPLPSSRISELKETLTAPPAPAKPVPVTDQPTADLGKPALDPPCVDCGQKECAFQPHCSRKGDCKRCHCPGGFKAPTTVPAARLTKCNKCTRRPCPNGKTCRFLRAGMCYNCHCCPYCEKRPCKCVSLSLCVNTLYACLKFMFVLRK